MTLRAPALDQVGGLDAGDGSMEPGVGEQEVVCLLEGLLWQREYDGTWRAEEHVRMQQSDPQRRSLNPQSRRTHLDFLILNSCDGLWEQSFQLGRGRAPRSHWLA